MSKKIQMYTDGGARGNPGPAAIGVILCADDGTVLVEQGEVIGETTNNVAEYTAVLVGLELASQFSPDFVECFVDSLLVANQVNGKFKIKAPHIQVLHKKVKDKMKTYPKVTFIHVPRTHQRIQLADKQVNRALDEGGY